MAYQNFFSTRLYTDINAGDTSITLETPPTATSGRLVLNPRNPAKREIVKYTGVSGNQITGVLRGQGGTSATSHSQNDTVEMNITAEDISDLYDAFNSFAPGAGNGWITSVATLSTTTGYNQGNRSFVLDSDTDLTSILSPGMRLKVDRGTAAPTQCTDLEASSSQYASRSSGSVSGITFTDDFTCEAWIKLESYTLGGILTRYNGTSGWRFLVESDGRLTIRGNNGNSSNYRGASTYQSIPLGRWVHVAASLDMSGSSATIYIDGVSVPVSFGTGGTSPSTLTQAGNLEVGSFSASNFLDGKIADVRVWSAIRTQTEIQDNMNQQLVGNETNLVAYFKLDGDFNDSTSNANHLTGSGGATADDADNPMKDTEYAIVTKVESDKITVFTGTDHTIPNDTLTDFHYSTQKVPFGFPAARGKWLVDTIDIAASFSKNSPTVNVWYHTFNTLAIPIGSWDVGYEVALNFAGNSGSQVRAKSTLATVNNDETDFTLTNYSNVTMSTGGTTNSTTVLLGRRKHIETTTSTPYYLNVRANAASMSLLSVSTGASTIIRAECAYL